MASSSAAIHSFRRPRVVDLLPAEKIPARVREGLERFAPFPMVRNLAHHFQHVKTSSRLLQLSQPGRLSLGDFSLSKLLTSTSSLPQMKTCCKSHPETAGKFCQAVFKRTY